jgi:hypothetical protein
MAIRPGWWWSGRQWDPEQGFDVKRTRRARRANPREGKISNESPIGKGDLEPEVGDTVTVETPSGMYKVKVIKERGGTGS